MDGDTELKVRCMSMGEEMTAFVTECGKLYWCGMENYRTPTRARHMRNVNMQEDERMLLDCKCTSAGVLLLDDKGTHTPRKYPLPPAFHP